MIPPQHLHIHQTLQRGLKDVDYSFYQDLNQSKFAATEHLDVNGNQSQDLFTPLRYSGVESLSLPVQPVGKL